MSSKEEIAVATTAVINNICVVAPAAGREVVPPAAAALGPALEAFASRALVASVPGGGVVKYNGVTDIGWRGGGGEGEEGKIKPNHY